MADRRRLDSNKLSNRFLGWTFGLSLSVILIIITGSYYSVANIYSSSQLENAQSLSSGLGLSIEDKLLAKDYVEVESILRRAFINRSLELAVVVNQNGKTIIALNRVPGQDDPKLFFSNNQLLLPSILNGAIEAKQSEELERIIVWNRLDTTTSLGWLYLEINDEVAGLILSKLKNSLLAVSLIIFSVLYLTLLRLNAQFKVNILRNESLLINEGIEWNEKAHTDSLTKLPNRMALSDLLVSCINHADEERKLLGILFLDLDGFKLVNDQYGHLVGDLLLIQVAQRLTNYFRIEDKVLRFGGDEFVIICQNLESKQELETLVDRVLVEMKESYDLNGVSLKATFSIGVTIYPLDKIDSGIELIAHADEAMYKAKELDKNRSYFYC